VSRSKPLGEVSADGDGRGERVRQVHCVGIGGIGISAIARVLLDCGIEVTGSDMSLSVVAQALSDSGAVVSIGHDASHLGDADAVLISSAIPDDNPEVVEARRRGIPVYRRSEFLGRPMAQILGDKVCIAVAGTHGKTTTTSMIVWILTCAGQDPTFIVGGVIRSLGTNARAGSGRHFVIEADEYDRMFLGLSPTVAAITHLEHDHPDCFPTFADMRAAFEQFVGLVPKHGMLVGCGDQPAVAALLQGTVRLRREDRSCAPATIQSCGLGEENDWRAIEVKSNLQGGHDFAVLRPGHLADELHPFPAGEGGRSGQGMIVRLAVPGKHNVQNALIALAIADWLGIDGETIVGALATFPGVKRRFEVRTTAGDPADGCEETDGLVVIDDYGHHPTEIRATLAAARARYGARPLWAVFQPHTFSRLRTLWESFGSSFADADHVIVLDVYAAREEDALGSAASDLASAFVQEMEHEDARYMGDMQAAAAYIVSKAEPDTVVITLSAGDGNEVGTLVMELWGNRRTKCVRRTMAHGPETPEQVRPLATELEREGLIVRRDEPMSAHTTYQIGGPADLFVVVESQEQLLTAVGRARQHHVLPFILGGGANLLVADAGIRGLVIAYRGASHSFRPDAASAAEASEVLLWAEAGAAIKALARESVSRGLEGLEWAVDVPGTLGGAIVGNAGAFGGYICDSLREVTALEADGTVHDICVADIEFCYRGSKFKQQAREERTIVLSATLALRPGDPDEITVRASEYTQRRRERQPPDPSCGSVFKRTERYPAGFLIDQCGLKGVRRGNAQISTEHANFIVNLGGARASDVKALIELAQQEVKARFDQELELEVELVGQW
jgi:UDP-N-acetylmuramate--alanine ligase